MGPKFWNFTYLGCIHNFYLQVKLGCTKTCTRGCSCFLALVVSCCQISSHFLNFFILFCFEFAVVGWRFPSISYGFWGKLNWKRMESAKWKPDLPNCTKELFFSAEKVTNWLDLYEDIWIYIYCLFSFV